MNGIIEPEQIKATNITKSSKFQPLIQKPYELNSHFKARQRIYNKVVKDLNDPEKAECYANIYYNITYMKSVYTEELTNQVMKYDMA